MLTHHGVIPHTHTRPHTRTQLTFTQLIVSFVPNFIYGARLNLDTAKGVALGDWPRWVVVFMQWSTMGFNWFNYFVPFLDLSDDASRSLKISRDIMKIVFNHGQCQWMLGFHIVGMLSSSYQGPETTQGGPSSTVALRNGTLGH